MNLSTLTPVTPTLADLIPLTDVTDANNTKNATIASILALLTSGIGTYADNAAAITGGVAVGGIYRITGTDHLGIVH